MFKKGLFILMAALIVGALSLSSCSSEPPNQTTPPANTELDTVKTDVAKLKTDVSAIKSTLAGLETPEDYQAAIDVLVTIIDEVEANISTINSKFSDYATKAELDAFNTQLDNVYGDVEDLGVRVNEAETAIANVINSINTLEAEIAAIEIPEPGEVDLTEVYEYVDNEINEAIIALNLLIEETNSYILMIESRVEALENAPEVTITKILDNKITVKTNNTDKKILVTVYGSGLNFAASWAEYVNVYATDEVMVVVFEPTDGFYTYTIEADGIVEYATAEFTVKAVTS